MHDVDAARSQIAEPERTDFARPHSGAHRHEVRKPRALVLPLHAEQRLRHFRRENLALRVLFREPDEPRRQILRDDVPRMSEFQGRRDRPDCRIFRMSGKIHGRHFIEHPADFVLRQLAERSVAEIAFPVFPDEFRHVDGVVLVD